MKINGMQPHPRPTHKQTHAFSIGDGNKKRHKVQQVCRKKKNTKPPSTPSL